MLKSWYQDKKNKVLIFSRYTKVLDVLGKFCVGVGYRYLRLDGATKTSERSKLCEGNLIIYIFLK